MSLPQRNSHFLEGPKLPINHFQVFFLALTITEHYFICLFFYYLSPIQEHKPSEVRIFVLFIVVCIAARTQATRIYLLICMNSL